jgi:hypothetical protein
VIGYESDGNIHDTRLAKPGIGAEPETRRVKGLAISRNR